MTNTVTPASSNDCFALLKAPFSVKDIEWRIGQTNQDKTRGRALPYLKGKAVTDRLDDVLGEGNWQNEYSQGPAGGVVCRVSVRIDGAWVYKENGAGNTEYEGVKGGLTDAFKRAAMMWGVGRYLQSYDALAVDIDAKGHFQPPALPDDFLPPDEVLANQAAFEAAEKATQDPVVSVPASEPPKLASKPAKPAKAEVLKSAAAKAIADSLSAIEVTGMPLEEPQSTATVAEANVAVKASSPEQSATLAVATMTEAPVATPGDMPVEDVPVVERDSAGMPATFESADVTVTTLTADVAVAEAEKISGTPSTALVEDVAIPETITPVEEVTAEPGSVTLVAAPVGDTSLSDAPTIIAVDEHGAPVMPSNLSDEQMARISQMASRIEKNAISSVVQGYLNSPKGLETVTEVSRNYLLALLAHRDHLAAKFPKAA